jgi:phosphate transport system permease protein
VSVPEQREIVIRRGRADTIFRGVIAAGAMLSLVLLALIAGFLLFRGFEIFKDFGFSFITGSQWDAGSGDASAPAHFGIAAMLVGSIVTAVIALVVAVPFAIAVSLFLEYYAPQFIRKPLTAVLDLVAAIPSVIYGIWGYSILMPKASGWAKSLNSWFDWIWVFKVPAPIFDRSPFIAGLLLALMVLPITTSVAREVYSQAPRDQIDAAYGLGGTKWGAIRSVVMPFGRSGLVGGAMLGLGRALGETVAVYLVLNLVFKVNFQILASAGGNVASLIATRFGEATPYELKALMAAGLVLFLVTLAVNATATYIVSRSRTSA